MAFVDGTGDGYAAYLIGETPLFLGNEEARELGGCNRHEWSAHPAHTIKARQNDRAYGSP